MRGRWLAAAVAGVVGCAGVRLAPDFAASGGYARALAHHTRAAELYQGFDTVAKGWATWKSPGFRAALAEASAAAYALSPGAAADLGRDEGSAGQRVREFHLALYTPKADWGDLAGLESLWRAYVELAGGSRLEALQVKAVPKSDRAPVAYPYVTRWTREFTLTFPLLDPTEAALPPTLVLAGPLGELRFAFR